MAKKKKEKARSYEGEQYRGGRAAGTKNLKKVEGGFVNEHGVFFTTAQRKALESAVNTANRKRARMLKEEATLPRLFKGIPTGETVGQARTLNNESDFILAQKSKSLQQFKTMAGYESYMRNLKRVNQRGYIGERVKRYKENYLTALKNSFGATVPDIIERIDKMSDKEFMRKLQQDEFLELSYWYPADVLNTKANELRASLHMELKDG